MTHARGPVKPALPGERGIALALAIFALLVVGALVAGALFAGAQEQRIGENTGRLGRSFGVAEVGITEALRTWDPQVVNATPIWPTGWHTVTTRPTPAGTGAYSGRILKLNGDLYLIDVTGVDRGSQAVEALRQGAGARQHLGLIARIRPLEMDIKASLTAHGGVDVSGSAVVNGNDQAPPGWASCDPPDTNRIGIRAGGPVRLSGDAQVAGSPPLVQEPVPDSVFTQFGDSDYDALTAKASIRLPPGTYGTRPSVTASGTCNTADPLNWGDGSNGNSLCSNHFPTIHVRDPRGSTTLTGYQGQGILLVDGDLIVQGTYEFFGITIVRGRLVARGDGPRFWGGVLARTAELGDSTSRGPTTVSFSKCAIVNALQMTGIAAPLRSRTWAQLF